MRFPRLNPYGLKKHGGRDVVRVSDKWDRHPRADGLVLRVNVPGPPSGPRCEEDRTGDRQYEGESNRHGTPRRSSHVPI